MHDKEADLRMLYQVYSSQIEFSKNQQWRAAYFAVWVLAGILGLFKVFSNWEYRYIFPSLTILTAALSTCFIILHEHSMRCARRQYEQIRARLSSAFRSLVEYDPDYTLLRYDANFWMPLILSLWVGCALIYVHMRMEMGKTCLRQVFLSLHSLISFLISLCFFLICYFWRRVSKRIKRRNNN